MHLPQATKYSLQAMSELAALGPQETIGVGALSKKAKVPVHFLSKVMRRLVVSGLVISKKGTGGGYQLAHPPAKIHLIDILEASQYKLDLGKCLFGWPKCGDAKPCPMHNAWKGVKTAFLQWATSTTLADLKKEMI